MMDLWLFSESKLRTKFDTIKMRNEILNLTYRNYALELIVGNCVFITKAKFGGKNEKSNSLCAVFSVGIIFCIFVMFC